MRCALDLNDSAFAFALHSGDSGAAADSGAYSYRCGIILVQFTKRNSEIYILGFTARSRNALEQHANLRQPVSGNLFNSNTRSPEVVGCRRAVHIARCYMRALERNLTLGTSSGDFDLESVVGLGLLRDAAIDENS